MEDIMSILYLVQTTKLHVDVPIVHVKEALHNVKHLKWCFSVSKWKQ